MKMSLGPIETTRKTGAEQFRVNGKELGFSLIEFWQWSGPDLVTNAQRGILAEYLVARVVGAGSDVRGEWDAYDLVTANGTKAEVKASGYVQSWYQSKLSAIRFGIAPKRARDASTNTFPDHPVRSADVDVFALHSHKDQETVNPLEIDQWEFYVLGARVLDRECADEKGISLAGLERLGAQATPFAGLSETIEAAARQV